MSIKAKALQVVAVTYKIICTIRKINKLINILTLLVAISLTLFI